MVRYAFTTILLVLVVCSFCGKDFKSLGRHVWRCKEKIKGNKEKDQGDAPDDMDAETSPKSLSSTSRNPPTVNCSCRKMCNGLNGLNMHQRSCRVIKGLAGETFEIQVTVEQIVEPDRNEIIEDNVYIKTGVTLPKSLDQWKFANDYFRATLPIAGIKISNLPSIINNMNNGIYNYFAKKFGLVNSAKNADLDSKYKGYSNHKLKSCLKQLKHSGADIVEIRFLSHFLRSRLTHQDQKLARDTTMRRSR